MSSALQFMKEYINGCEIDTVITRHSMHAAFRKKFNQVKSLESLDSYKSYFVKIGFLGTTGVNGTYKVLQHIPLDLKAIDIRRMYNEATGFTEKKDIQFGDYITNSEYLNLKYKPIEFIVMNKLSFIQGSILILLIEYAEHKEFEIGDELMQKLIYYATIAENMNHISRTIHYKLATVARFCEINGLSYNETVLFKRALQSNWKQFLAECNKLINNENLTDEEE